MCDKMPCGITDGPQTPEEAAEYWEWIFKKFEPDQFDRDEAAEERDADINERT